MQQKSRPLSQAKLWSLKIQKEGKIHPHPKGKSERGPRMAITVLLALQLTNMAGTVVQETGSPFKLMFFYCYKNNFSGTFQSTDVAASFFAEYPSNNRFLNVTEVTFDSNTVINVSFTTST